MSGNTTMTAATGVMIVHEVGVAPDEIGAGPQYQDEYAQDAGVHNLCRAPLARHLRKLILAAVGAENSLG